ncbi:MipA/OmpV family protein [Erwinia psidii]|nr:MipA/OmpV family protein [Erwinia psidii]MCX8955893.1 MipA/OmpV family protein [Erwinia psidii]
MELIVNCFKVNTLTLTSIIGFASVATQANPLSLGASVIYSQSPYKGGEGRYFPLPIINYEGDSVYFRSVQAGYYLWKDRQDQLSLTVMGSPQGFDTDHTDDNQLKKLDNRHMTLMAGLDYRHIADWGMVRTSLVGDALGNSNGYQWDVAWLYRFQMGNFSLTPGLGVVYSSAKQNNYYYGISKQESRRSSLASYDAGDSWDPYLEMTASWSLTPRWNATLSGRYTHPGSAVKDSPMVNNDFLLSVWTGVSYTF